MGKKAKKQFVVAFLVVTLAFVVLVTSILRSASVRCALGGVDTPIISENGELVNYELPYPGRVRPDSPLWPAKVARDRVWMALTTNPLKKAEVALLLSDKRLGAAVEIFEKGDLSLGANTIERSELYLAEALNHTLEAKSQNMQTKDFLKRLAIASLKHREVLEALHEAAPGEIRPVIVQKMDFSKLVFEKSNQTLQDMGEKAIENPF